MFICILYIPLTRLKSLKLVAWASSRWRVSLRSLLLWFGSWNSARNARAVRPCHVLYLMYLLLLFIMFSPCSAFIRILFAVWIHMYFTIFATLRRCLHERCDLKGAYVPEAYTSYERSEVRKVFKAFDEDGSGSLDTEEIEQVMCSFGITPFKSTVEALQKFMLPFHKGFRSCFILLTAQGL